MSNILLSILGISILLFVFGPGVVGGFDLGCWFLTNSQCTSVLWTDGRQLWAALPWVIAVLAAICSGA